MLGFDGQYLAGHPQAEFWRFRLKLAKNQLYNIPYKNLFDLISWIYLQPFV